MSAETVPAKAAWDTVVVRPLGPGDIDAYVDYWHDQTNGFLDDMGIDRARMPAPGKMREQLALSLTSENKQSSHLIIDCDGVAVGVHELTDMADGTAVMHAHMFAASARGRGIGRISYVKAMGVYFDRYNLTAIEFRTPKSNIGANRIKHHLGLYPLGEVDYALPIFKKPIPSNLYRVEAGQYDAIAARAWRAFE
jgi:hypothetical protein